MSANIFDTLRARVTDPGKTAIETPDGARISYGDLYARAGRMAQALAQAGVEPGDRVAAQIDKSPEAVVLALACFRAGAALLPLNTAYTLAELAYFLGDAEPALTLCRPAQLEAVRELGRELGLRAVESLGDHGDGTFSALRGAGERGTADHRARRRRSRGDPLHVRHDGPLQGRDADA